MITLTTPELPDLSIRIQEWMGFNIVAVDYGGRRVYHKDTYAIRPASMGLYPPLPGWGLKDEPELLESLIYVNDFYVNLRAKKFSNAGDRAAIEGGMIANIINYLRYPSTSNLREIQWVLGFVDEKDKLA